MSHDQKPGKLRLVGNSTPQRRRGDEASVPGLPEGVAAGGSAAGKTPSFLTILVFVLGCALGGAAVPLLGVL